MSVINYYVHKTYHNKALKFIPTNPIKDIVDRDYI